MTKKDEIRIGVSSCLLGEPVRYDGGHKRHRMVVDVLPRHFRVVPICPEVECGMGVPREPVRLVRTSTSTIRMIGTKTATDHTTAMTRYARHRATELERLGLSGYVFKQGSPSCGVKRVRTVTSTDTPAPSSRGLFSAALIKVSPLLPIEDEIHLSKPTQWEHFLTRVFAYHRIRSLFSGSWQGTDLATFHARETLLLMAHDPHARSTLTRLLANASSRVSAEMGRAYEKGFMYALTRPPTPAQHARVLRHAFGYFATKLSAPQKHELLKAIEGVRRRLVPLAVPWTLIRQYIQVHAVDLLISQTYFHPQPVEIPTCGQPG